MIRFIVVHTTSNWFKRLITTLQSKICLQNLKSIITKYAFTVVSVNARQDQFYFEIFCYTNFTELVHIEKACMLFLRPLFGLHSHQYDMQTRLGL